MFELWGTPNNANYVLALFMSIIFFNSLSYYFDLKLTYLRL